MKTKKITTILFLLILLLSFHLMNAQSWQWAKSALGNQGDDEGHGISFDGMGNVYVTGRIQDSCDFAGTVLVKGMFIAKYDSTGNLQWANESQGVLYEFGEQIQTDANGNSYIAGGFRDTATFGSNTIMGMGGVDAFVAKYAANGNNLWVKAGGSKNWDNINALALDASGNTYITGSFSDTAFFGGNILTTGSSANSDIYIVKYDANGTVQWARKAGGSKYDAGREIAVDGSGNYYVTGNFKDTITFGSTTLISKGTASPDFFMVKYDAAGNVIWAKQASGKGDEEPDGIAVSANGNVFVTGYFTDTVAFGNITLISSPLSSGDIFTVKYDASGNELWAKKGSSSNWDEAKDIALDNAGGCYITGGFSDTMIFENDTLIGSVNGDIFIVRYDANGNVVWTMQSGGASGGQARGIAADGNGAVYITGQFDSTITFGSTTLANYEIVPGDHDIFVAKLKDTTITTTIQQLSISNLQFSVSIYPNPFSASATLVIASGAKQSPPIYDLQFTIYNLLGEVVFQSEIRSSQFEIQRNNLADGIYFYQIKNENKTLANGKLIIQ